TMLDRGRWTSLFGATRAALTAADELERALGAHLDSPPTLHRTRAVLRGLEGLIEATVGIPREEPLPDVAGAAPPEPGAPRADAPPQRAPGAPLKSRAEAYRQLADAADYLLRTEPHSPVPYLVKRAISWGNMSLAELLAEFVGSPDDLVTIYRLLGIRGRDEG
ncbi:MAG TPA: hypothetical protein VLS89_11195, partial [Candidatus Nanopelagicales bacterium]|nr:hypothetical protein [Candidatus Nanopelagicales bacterium]